MALGHRLPRPYGVQVAKRTIAANKAGVAVVTDDVPLAVANAYFDLQQAARTLAIAREAAGNAQVLGGITGTDARSGAGLEADHRRSLGRGGRRRSGGTPRGDNLGGGGRVGRP